MNFDKILEFWNRFAPENFRIEWRQEALDEFLSSLKELASEFTGPTQRGGADMASAPFLPAAGQDEAANRVLKLSDAVMELHLFYAYALRKVFAVEFKKNLEVVHDSLKQFAGKQAWNAMVKTGVGKAMGNVMNLVVKIARTADVISHNRKVAQRIRFHGRASRLGILDSTLFGNNPRSRKVVMSRHGWGRAVRRKKKEGIGPEHYSGRYRDQRTVMTEKKKAQLAKARKKTRSAKVSRRRKKQEAKRIKNLPTIK